MSLTQEQLAQRAMTSTAPPRVGFGQVVVCELSGVIFDKSLGRYVDFDENQHNINQVQTAIKLVIRTYKRAGGTYDAERKYIDNNAQQNAWRDLTRPSMNKVGLSLTALQDQWVQYELKRTGRTWTSNDKDTGEPKTNHEETFVFVKKFANQEDCDGHYAEYLMGTSNGDDTSSNGSSNGAASDSDTTDADDAPLKRALMTLWNASGPDEKKFAKQFNSNKVMNKAVGGRWTLQEAMAIVNPTTESEGESSDEDDEEDLPF